MSHAATEWAFTQTGLPANAKLVLVTLAYRHNQKNGCFPSQQRVAEDTGLSVRAVRGAMSMLEDKDLIRRTRRRANKGLRTSDAFTFAFEAGFADLPPRNGAINRQDLPVASGTTCRNQPAGGAGNERQDLPVASGTTCRGKRKKGKEEELNSQSQPEGLKDAISSQQDRFDEFWAAYPGKTDEPPARKAWAKAIKKHDPEKIIAAAKVYAVSEKVQRGFVRNPSGWLDDESFNNPENQPKPADDGSILARDWWASRMVR
jgi:hypothetical protein